MSSATGSTGTDPGSAPALETIDGQAVLRFERTLRHDPETVWRAVTEPAELAHWFPARVETELRVGAAMRFVFEGADQPMDETGPMDGEVLELDPPKVFAFRWNHDVLRFELVPHGQGCLLVFTHALGGDWVGRLAAGRNAVGWESCLGQLQARLDDETFEQPTDWLPRIEGYVTEFGLAEGSVRSGDDTYLVHFARDLMWMPVEKVWGLLVEGDEPEAGAAPPLRATNGFVPAGSVTEVAAPHVLEYAWLQDGAPAGRVRFELAYDRLLGSRVVLTQTVPAERSDLLATALAAWQTHLELMFAAVMGETRRWPDGRTEELEATYRDRLDVHR